MSEGMSKDPSPSEGESSDDLAETLYYHGTRAALLVGDLIKPGYKSNFGSHRLANHVYLTATVDAATWGAELAAGEEPGRIYVVEPTGTIEDDPNLTDKKFPGNPTKSYRSREPLRVIGELTEWEGHDPELLNSMKAQIERLRELGVEAIDE
ncbi:MAG: NAD(+)--rifampin ADP-ribosyltransferase [Actinomycetes bacterium]